VRNPATGEYWYESPDHFLTPWQSAKMQTRPDLIRQFSHHLAAITEQAIGAPVKVRVKAQVTLNGHPPGVLIDPEMDLSTEPYRLTTSKWILPEPEAESSRPAGHRRGSALQKRNPGCFAAPGVSVKGCL